MGNRAVIKFVGEKFGVYLHWNGGRDSVEAFLKYCELRGFRCDGYGVARFAQVVGNWFGGGLSLGIIDAAHKPERLDPGDNGVYWVKNWRIVRRYPKDVIEQREYDLDEFVKDIDRKQPANDRLGDEFFDSVEVPVESLKLGDTILMREWDDKFVRGTVIGFGDGRYVNGERRNGVPYTDRFSFGDPKDNPNNYLTEKTYRLVKEG